MESNTDKNAANGQADPIKRRRKSVSRSFPASTFEDALIVPKAIQKYAAGQKVRRLTLFDHLGKAPGSGPSRQLITNASRYGLIEGNYSSEHLTLTPDGTKATDPETPPRERRRLEFKLAVSEIKPFQELYQKLQNNRLPSKKVLTDYLLDNGYSEAEVSECVDTFIVNAKHVGILKTLSGAETIVPIEHALEETPTVPSPQSEDDVDTLAEEAPPRSGPDLFSPPSSGEGSESWDTTCFYITPIGEDGSEHRQHSDLFLRHIVEPALEEFGLRVIRADHIGKPGMITGQVIEHIVKSKLVVADLSFHNPNVFYELALRHATRRPTVQIIRSADRIPFDIDQYRTIKVDTTNIYTLVPHLDVYRSEISNQVRRSMEDEDSTDNPIATFYPSLRVVFQK